MLTENYAREKCLKELAQNVAKWTKFEQVMEHPCLKKNVDEVWLNNQYEVHLEFMDKEKGKDGLVWLQLKDIVTKEARHDWREMQRIKNEIMGDEREAVELFPAESRLVDTSNQFHLFVMPVGEQMGFGYGYREIAKGHNDFVRGKGGSRQRPFEIDPSDAVDIKELNKIFFLTSRGV